MNHWAHRFSVCGFCSLRSCSSVSPGPCNQPINVWLSCYLTFSYLWPTGGSRRKPEGGGGEMSLGVLSPSFSSICRKFHLLWWLQWQLQKAGVTLEAVGSVITTTTEAASTNHLPPPRAQPAGSAMSSVLVTVCHSQGWLTVSWTYQSPLGCLAFSFCSFRSFKAITSSSLNQIS